MSDAAPPPWVKAAPGLSAVHGEQVDAAIGCGATDLGAQARISLGRPLSPSVLGHVSVCLACRLERLAFERFQDEPTVDDLAGEK